MPYGISNTRPDCSGWATVKQNSDGSYETVACHDTKQDAIDQMVAVSIAEDVEPLGEVGTREARAEGEILVVDIDDTLLTNGVEPMRDVIDAVNASGYPVVLLTGRDPGRREETIAALTEAGVVWERLIMHSGEQDEASVAAYKRDAVMQLMNEGYEIDAFVDNSQANRDAIAELDIDVYSPSEFVADQAEEEVEVEEPEEEPMEFESRAVDLSAPQFMRASAARGLRLHEQGLSGDGLVPATVADARRMANGQVSAAKWRKIGPWIARHIDNLDAVQGDEITPGLVAMLLWGGGSSKTSARRTQQYAERIVAQLDADSGTSRSSGGVYDGRSMEATSTVHWITDQIDERRSVAYTTLELRAEGDSNTLVGYAAVFDSPSEPMPFVEYVRRGAFTKTLNDGADVRLLIDHEGVPLARTKSGTLMLEEDERGLRVEASLDPMNPDAQRVLSAMRRGDLSQMSFAFRTIKDSWNSDRTMRELREVQLFDVSVVTYPAYEDTVVSVRSRQPATVSVSSGLTAARQRQLQIARHR